MKSSFGGFQAAFLNFMPKRDAEVITEAPPTIDDLPNCKRKNVEQITPPQSLKKPKVLIYRNFIIIQIRQKRVVGTDVKSNRLVETISESQICIGLRNM